MNKKINSPRIQTARKPEFVTSPPFPMALFGGVAIASLLGGYGAWAQIAPRLALARSATNQFSISITNATLADSYEIWWTPELANTNFPWTAAAVGTIGQTNFILSNWEYPSVLFRGLLDTNNPPLWENANPIDPTNQLLRVTIANPTNGATLN